MTNGKIASAVFGGGCFWCTEAVFDELRGVQSVISGYAGGTTKNPTYEQVCSGSTGHAFAKVALITPIRNKKASRFDSIFLFKNGPTKTTIKIKERPMVNM